MYLIRIINIKSIYMRFIYLYLHIIILLYILFVIGNNNIKFLLAYDN